MDLTSEGKRTREKQREIQRGAAVIV